MRSARSVVAIAAAIATAALAAGCVEQGPGPKPRKVEPTYVQEHLLAAPPAGIRRFDVAVGDVAMYLGNTVDKPRVAPGQAVTITHYWKILRSPGPRWKVFTLVRGAPGTADFQNLDPTDMQFAHGPAAWQPGEIVEDVQRITLRPDWRSKHATVLVGLIEHGEHGTLDRMLVAGPFTRDRAIVARELEVDLARAPPPKGTAYVPRAQGAITIDGVATETGWAGAAQTELITAQGGSDPKGKAIAKLTWDDQFLYLWVSITDSDIVSSFTKHDDPLWKGDCVEVFVDADGNRRGYVELQVSPAGVVFDSWFAGTRSQPGDVKWNSQLVAAVKLRGSVKAADSGDQGWDVEVGIPWAAVKGRDANMKVALPPRVGDRWRLNVVRVDRRTGDGKHVTVASWNRITMADFHALDRMLTAVFADASGSIVPRARPAAAATGPIEVALIAKPGAGAIVVELLARGGAKIDGTQVKAAELARALASRDRTSKLAIRAQPSVWHVRASGVLERARQAGFAGLELITAVDLGLARRPAKAPATGPLPLGVVVDTSHGLELVVKPDGGVELGGKRLTDADLDRVLAALAARNAEVQVIVRPAGGVRYAHVLGALEHARLAGFERLAIGEPVVEVPAGAAAVLARHEGPLALEVSNAETRFGGAAMNDDQLAALLEQALAKDRALEVVLEVAPATSHARLVKVLGIARGAGVARVALATKAGAAPALLQVDPKQPSLRIDLTLDGRVVIGGRAVAADQLAATLGARAKADPATQVILRADRGVAYARVVAVIDAARQAGLERVAITPR